MSTALYQTRRHIPGNNTYHSNRSDNLRFSQLLPVRMTSKCRRLYTKYGVTFQETITTTVTAVITSDSHNFYPFVWPPNVDGSVPNTASHSRKQ